MNKFVLLGAVAALTLSACTPRYEGMPPPGLTFENYAPVNLNVQSVEVFEDYEVKTDPQDLSGQFVVPPSEAIKRYIDARFQARGTGTGRFTVAIEDARVHLNELREQNRVLNWSGIGQEDEYEVFVRLKITPVPDGARAGASTLLKMNRTLVMPSSVTVAEREMRQTRFLEKLIADIDAGIMKSLNDLPGIY